ncbi:MAG: BREX-1 system phosphatase PglZ type A, partial [Desulfohalobiaceae bacterium]
EIEKFGLGPFFWEEMTRTFGYHTKAPNLSDLLIRILIGDLANTLQGELPSSLQHFRLQEQQANTNVSVFVDQWRKHLGHYKQYIQLSAQVAEELGLQEQLAAYDAHSLLDVMTFEVVERQIIRSLRSQIIQEESDRFDHLKAAILSRRDGHWASIHLEGYEHTSNIYATTYDGLDAVLDLLELRREYAQGLSFASADQMYQAYVRELYRFDQLYRHFHEAADIVELAGWDVLKEVQKVVESCYSNWYLEQISLCWGEFMNGESGLLADWTLRDVHKQQYFFSTQVKPLLSSSRSKVFVIISDALRYEAAEELTRDINSKSRFKANLQSQLGVLPSYTALGMAALLPRSRYGYKQDSDQILVDGKPCASLEQRQEILSQHAGIAVRAEDLLAMNKDQGRELVRPWQVIYIYHNQIDATGDAASTETRTFSAVRKGIAELSSLVRFIVNSLNGSNVLVTADHGFLYQDTPPGWLEKSDLGYKPEGVVKAKKRYILGHNLGESENVWHGLTYVTAGTEDKMEFWIPKGVNRFHFSGGAKFIHGGALPQEVVVPVLRVKELDAKTAEKEAVRKVGVSLLGSTRKLVNTICKFEFIQTEKVSDRMLPRTLVASIRDGDALISNEQTVTFDSDSDSMEERKRVVKLMLKKGSYDNTKEYALVLRDPETQIEYERIPVNIDLAFMDDF